MRRFHYLIRAFLIVSTLLYGSISYTPATAAPSSDVLSDPFNDRLAVQVASNGRFNIGAFPDPQTGGAITGQSWDLIYRWPSSPSTSFTTFRIDGTDHIYGSSGTQLEAPHDIDSNTNRSTWQIGDMEIIQTLQIIFNNQTNQEDVAKISYTIRNTGSVSHTIGTRVMIDTEINYNDGAPFRVPGVGIVRKESEYIDAALPDTFQAFFNLTDNEHIAVSTIKTDGETNPDRLVLAHWSHLYNATYDYTIDPNFDFSNDSAYAVYWDPKTLDPGNEATHVTYYGLGQLNVDLEPPLALGVTGPASLSVVNNQYSPNPFDVVATVFNNGSATATNVQLTLNLPAGLSLAAGTATQSVGDLAVGQERQISWSVSASPQTSSTLLTYSVTATASNIQSKTVSRNITVPALLSSVVSDASTYSSDCGPDSGISCTAECTQGSVGGPINTRTGGYDYSATDISISTSAGNLNFERSYASLTTGVYTSNLGYGWTHNQDMYLSIGTYDANNQRQIILKGHTANQYMFTQTLGSSTTTPEPGVYAELTQGSNTFTLTDTAQNKYEFDVTTGKLVSYSDPNNHTWSYIYDVSGNLDRVSADGGARYLDVDYDTQERVSSVSDHTGRSVSYHYDTKGDLDSFVDVLGQTWTYEYHPTLDHLLTRVAAPGNVTVERTEYYPNGRAWKQYDGESNLVVELIYNADGSTTVKDALGSTEAYLYDGRGTLVSEENAAGAEQKHYDFNFRPTTVTNDAGHTLQMIWSADGANMLSKTDPAGNSSTYAYDSFNNLISVTDARNLTTTYTYNGKLLTSSEDPLGGVTTYTYTPQGYLESVTDAAGRVTSYTYDSFGQRTSMTDPSNNTWNYTYDSLGRLINTTDPRGRVTHNEYDAAGKLIRVTQNYNPSYTQNYQNLYNIVTEYELDARGNQIAVTDTYGRTTQYVYDDANRLLQTIDPAGNTTTNVYDAAGQLLSTTDPLGHTTTYEYDAAGRLVKTINPLGYHSGITTFNPSNSTSTVTDVLGRSTVFHYDQLGRVIKVVDPLGNFAITTYDENGNVETGTDQLSRTTQYEYDELNRLVRTIDPNGGITQTIYNASGYRIATIDPLNHQTTYTYDSVGRLIATTDPLNRVTQTEYDTYGRRSATIDAAGRRTTYTYDLLDRIITVTDPAGNTTHTTYDALGNVLTRTDANGNTITTTYDALNRPLTITDANGNATTNTYDAAGNLATVTDALGQTTTYTYDALNRQIAITDPLGHITQSQYDSLGNLSDVIDANGVVTHYQYDALNRQDAVILNYKAGVQPDAETNVRYEFGYNEVGNRISVKDPNGNITSYGYDALNRVTQKIDPLQNTWSYTYDLAGNRISANDAKNQTIQYTYDAAGQLTGINYPGTDPDVTFTYDLTGQRTGMTDGLGTTSWTYDNVNRPVSVTDAFNKTIGYGYDAVGNRTELTYPDGKTVTYTYDDTNQLTGVTDWESQNTAYTYDAVGHLSSISFPNEVSSQYAYDNAGKLTTLQHVNGAETLASYNYVYDPAGTLTQAVELLQNPQQFSSLNSGVVPVVQNLPKPDDFSASNQFVSYQLPEPQKAPSASTPQQIDFNRLPLSFIPNFGQEDEAVRFQAQGLGGKLFFTPGEVVFSLPNPVKIEEDDKEKIRYDLRPANVVRIHYQGANEEPEIEGIDQLPGVANYLIGNDPGKWRINLATYSGIAYRELYPGVELRYEGTDGNLKSSFHIAPGADPSAIVWRYKGVSDVTVDESGNLVIPLPEPMDDPRRAVLIEHAPVAWQEINGERVMVAVQYAIDKNDKKVSFLFPDGYDSTLPLVIDPTLTYSTYLGGGRTDEGHAITVDAEGNVYITGDTSSSNFPTVNPIQSNPPSKDIFVSKLNAAGDTLLYSTYIGGNESDQAWGIALDSQGRITIVGESESSDFPMQNAYNSNFAGGICSDGEPCDDVVVVQLTPDGTALRYSTYLGGTQEDNGLAMAIGPGDLIHFTGSTRSSAFPTFHAYDSTFGGGTCSDTPCYDAFVATIDPALSGSASVLYSTFLGGSDYDDGMGIVVDTLGHLYVAGYTRSSSFPTRDAYQATRAGSTDAFIAKFDTTLSGDASLLYSTYFGGSADDRAFGMALNDANQVYVTGFTKSTNFPLANPFDDAFGGGMCGTSACKDAFVTHLDIASNTLVSSSYLGGSNQEEGAGITIDPSGDVYVTGYTKSTDFSVTNAIQETKGTDSCSAPPCSDAFVVKVSATGNPLIYSTYLGGSGEDYGNAITQDNLGGAYITGYTFSSNFPTTSGAYDMSIGSTGYSDAFVTKIFDPLSEPPSATLTIDYTYDALHRPISATYSDGRFFQYTYDPAGNVLELQQNLGPGTIITTYTYDAANQLDTAQQGTTTWNYTYDVNGSLISDGVKTYTYDSANRLIQISDGSSVTSLTYNGLGQRLSMDAAGVIATYVLDGDLPLTATSSGNTTFFLYGRGPIGEKTSTWNYSLLDGTNTPRQLADPSGEITLSARYTPWGDTLELNGTGNFTFGYAGGILDAATGLLYVGNGQYYDPTTGRFLTRGVNPDSSNPYVPWNPVGAILGPLGVLSMFALRWRGKGNKQEPYLYLFIMLVVLPLSVGLACGTPTQPSNPPVQPQTPVSVTDTPGPTTVPATSTSTPSPAVPTPTSPCQDCTPTPMPSLELYGIVFDGTSWTADEQTAIMAAVQKVGEEFSRIRGTGEISWEAFKAVYGDKFLFYRDRSGITQCQANVQRVICTNNAPMSEVSPARLLVHELGHSLVWTRYNGVNTPYRQVSALQIVDDTPVDRGGPHWVTGTHPTRDECLNNSDPNSALGRKCAATEVGYYGYFDRTSLGYTGRGAPHQYHGEGWADFSTNANEDFADMFMNWVYNSFDYRPEAYNAGWYRYDFMESNMRNWITGGSITIRNSVP